MGQAVKERGRHLWVAEDARPLAEGGFAFLKDAKGRNEASIDAAAKAVDRFEEYSRHRDFKTFHFEQARGFKNHLTAESSTRTGKPLSASTVHATLGALKALFLGLADQRGYAS